MIPTKKMIKNVLLVEDNPAIRLIMQEAFKAASFEGQLDMAENGDDVMQYLKREKKFSTAPMPDIILMDLNLPGKSGIEVIGEIKKDDRLKNIPIVVLTGSNSSIDTHACSKFQCKYLLKPSRFHELVELVKSLPDFC